MARESVSHSHQSNGALKAKLRAAGERDFTPAQKRSNKEDAGGAERVRSAEGIGLFHGLSADDTNGGGNGKRSGNGNRIRNGNGDAVANRDPWLQDQLRLIGRAVTRAGRRARKLDPRS